MVRNEDEVPWDVVAELDRAVLTFITDSCNCDSIVLCTDICASLMIEPLPRFRRERGKVVPMMGDLEVSVSRTNGISALSLTRVGPLGVDIEKRRPPSVFAVSRRFFGTREAQAVAGAADAMGLFLRIWTLKEAHGKMLGSGLGQGGLSWEAPLLTDSDAWVEMRDNAGIAYGSGFVRGDVAIGIAAHARVPGSTVAFRWSTARLHVCGQ